MNSNKPKRIDNKSKFNSIELLFDEVIRIFKSDDIEVFTGANENVILDFEKNNSVKLSEELKLYFKKINGIDGAEFISKLNRISDLKKVKEYDWFSDTNFAHEELPKIENVFIIGDIMIDSHQWGIRLNIKGKTEEIIEMDYYEIISESISDFLIKFINQNPYSLVANR